MTSRRRWLAASLSMAILAWAACVSAQGPAPKKKDEGAWALFVLLPLGVLIATSLQVAVVGFFPRFARRCATAVRRYWWQTGLIGLAGNLAVLMMAALVGSLASGNRQAGAIPLSLGTLIAAIGGVGVSLVAGRWGLKRTGADAPAHPIVEVIAGGSLLGWAMLLLPCVGLLLWMAWSWAAVGAFLFAIVAGPVLDEAPKWTPIPAPPEPRPSVPSPPSALRAEGKTEGSGESQAF